MYRDLLVHRHGFADHSSREIERALVGRILPIEEGRIRVVFFNVSYPSRCWWNEALESEDVDRGNETDELTLASAFPFITKLLPLTSHVPFGKITLVSLKSPRSFTRCSWSPTSRAPVKLALTMFTTAGLKNKVLVKSVYTKFVPIMLILPQNVAWLKLAYIRLAELKLTSQASAPTKLAYCSCAPSNRTCAHPNEPLPMS